METIRSDGGERQPSALTAAGIDAERGAADAERRS